MSQRYLGGVITANPTTPTLSAATGVWTLEQQFQNVANWPKSTGLVSRSVRFRSSATAYFNRTPATASNRKTWTWSGWVKRGTLTADQRLFDGYSDASNWTTILFEAADRIQIAHRVGGTSTYNLVTTTVYRDPAAWYHIVVAFDTTQATSADRVKLYVNGTQITVFTTNTIGAQNVDTFVDATNVHNIGRYGAASQYLDGYLTEVNFIDGQALTPSYFGVTDANGVWQPATYSGTYGTNGFYLNFSDNSSTSALGFSQAGGTHVVIVEADGSNQTIGAGVGACRVSTISTSNWSYPSASNEYLVVTPASALPITSSLKIYFDIAYAWANGRNLYINGTQVATGNVTVATVGGMQEWTINYSGHGISSLSSITTPQNTGGRAQFYGISIDGSAVVATANDWTPNNISVTAGATYDSMLDVPVNYADGGNGRGNYPVWNPLRRVTNNFAITNGNLQASDNSSTNAYVFASMFLPSTGKWYWEITNVSGSGLNSAIGACLDSAAQSGSSPATTGFYRSNGQIQNIAGTNVTSGATYTAGDVIGIAVDVDNGTVQFYKNGTAQGATPSFTFTAGSVLVPFGSGDNSAGTKTFAANFGQRPFAYTPPTGFIAFNTQNLPAPSIGNGANYMAATLYTANASTLVVSNAVSGASFQPDLLWIKNRSSGTLWNNLFDALRGTTVRISSNSTTANATVTNGLTSFNSDGFTLGSDSGSSGINVSAGDNIVAWQWKAGGTAVSNTNGSITSTVSANTTAGFSIVSYTATGANATVGHGLGVAPSMIILKNTASGTTNWPVYHVSTTAAGATFLNATNAYAASATMFNSTAPTSTVFSVGTNANVVSGATIAYCFAPVAGYSAFGSYTGNGSTEGPFVYLGFRPRFVLFKRTDVVDDWVIHDSSRNTYNVVDDFLKPNLSNAEGAYATSGHGVDFLSSGMKLRTDSTQINASTGTYIYAAFAENPFKLSRAR